MQALDITSLANDWLSDIFLNHGLMLFSTGSNQNITSSSKENANPNRWPRLNIIYTEHSQP